jgi:hypothetical protein
LLVIDERRFGLDMTKEGMTLIRFATEEMRVTAEIIMDGRLSHVKEDATSTWVDLQDREKVKELADDLKANWRVFLLDYPSRGERKILAMGTEGKCRQVFESKCEELNKGTLILACGNLQVDVKKDGIRIRSRR